MRTASIAGADAARSSVSDRTMARSHCSSTVNARIFACSSSSASRLRDLLRRTIQAGECGRRVYLLPLGLASFVKRETVRPDGYWAPELTVKFCFRSTMTVAFVVTVAIFLGLLLFFVNELRRPVRDSKWDHRPLWGKRFRLALITILLLGVGVAGWAFFIEPNRLVTRHETLHINQWPSGLSDLKIAVLSDIHAGGWAIDDRKLHLIVERTNQLEPDLVIIPGDFVHGDGRRDPDTVAPEVFARALKGFRAPLGVYAVLGNHDWWYDGQRVRSALEANGIKVLENGVAKIETRGTSFWLAGLADLWTRPQHVPETIARVPEGETLIAVTHNPDIFPLLPQRVPLLIAGHTHGGQVRLPLIGSVVHVSKFDDRYEAGHVIENGNHLFVTTGIGTSIVPVRFGVPPEIVLVTLKSG